MPLNSKQEAILNQLQSDYSVLFTSNISLYHSYVIVIGLLAAAFIVITIILTGLIEVYRPIQRLRVFTSGKSS